VLFFVSVGMLFNPQTLWNAPWQMLATLFVIIVVKSAAAFGIVRAFGYSSGIALTIAASLAQIGEFSFILAELGVQLDLLPEHARDLILAGAILSIMLNPLIFGWVDRINERHERAAASPDAPAEDAPAVRKAPPDPATLHDHCVLAGYGGVGAVVAQALQRGQRPFVVIEMADSAIDELNAAGIAAVQGHAAKPEILARANLERSKCLIVAIPETFEAGQVVEQARRANAGLRIIARAHSAEEMDYLRSRGADAVVMGEVEIARGLIYELAAGESLAPEPA
jgi:CPA2 family monovalent cation:H+ antiporter-2